MSEQLVFDRAKGFVALPVEVLDLDLNPGAFRLLVELCRMANLDGYCWPSLEQLGDRLGRSRAAVSGYASELRAEGLIETHTQKAANGYNYRLKYRVTFWKDWRSSMRGAVTGQRVERRVQQDERPKDNLNQSHINQSDADEFDKLLKGWAECVKGAPYPSMGDSPSQDLLEKSKQFLLSDTAADPIISADIVHGLAALWADLSVDCSTADMRQQAETLKKKGLSRQQFETLFDRIKKAWPDHWRRPPESKQWVKMVSDVKVLGDGERRKLLASYLKRWDLAQKTLQIPRVFGQVSSTNTGRFPIQSNPIYPRI